MNHSQAYNRNVVTVKTLSLSQANQPSFFWISLWSVLAILLLISCVVVR
jgi:hypothetical protein